MRCDLLMKKLVSLLAFCLFFAGCGSGDGKGASRAPEAPAGGRLEVVSVPAGAGVWLDGRIVANTPFDAKPYAGKTLTLQYPGCEAVTVVPGENSLSVNGEPRTFSAAEGGSPRAVIEMPPMQEPSCVIFCTSTPEGAEVLLDGVSQGTTPLEIRNLEAKTYEIAFKLAEREGVTRKVSWREGETRKVVEVRLPSQMLEFYRKKMEEDPLNLLHYADLGHHLVLEGQLMDAMKVYKAGLKLIFDRKNPRDAGRLWAEIERVIVVQYTYGDSRTVDVARRILFGMLCELSEEYLDIGDINFYMNYINVADRLGLKQDAQEKFDAACKKWPGHKQLEGFVRRGYKKK